MEQPQDERRYSVKLTDVTGINYGIVTAEFVVIAENPAEAEHCVRCYMDKETGTEESIFETASIREIPFI